MYRLANGEEVVSNLFGQADRWRPLLKAINTGDDRRIASAVAAALQRTGHSGPATINHRTIAPQISIVNPVAVDPVAQVAEAAQLALAYEGIG